MGTSEGSIIATIITSHIPRNAIAAPNHDCPGMSIHVIDMAQPPGIRIPPDMDPHHSHVPTALATKSSAVVARNARSVRVAVVESNPRLRRFLVSTLRHQVEELIGAV